MKKILASALVALALVSTTANAAQCNKAADIATTALGCILTLGFGCGVMVGLYLTEQEKCGY